MKKEDIIKHYTAATRPEQAALTRNALDWLSRRGIRVSRDSLHHWRNKEMTRSPLSGKYRQAYEHAIKTVTEQATAAQ